MSRSSTPLSSHGVLRTTSVEDARASIAASLAPHELTPLREPDRFAAVHNTVDLDRLSLHYIDYGTEVEVATDRLDFHLVQIPLAGISRIRAGRSTLTATTRSATVTGPDDPVRMRYSSGNPRLMVRITPDLWRERSDVAAAGGLVVADGPGAAFDVLGGVGRGWRSLVELIIADVDRDDGLTNSLALAETLKLAVVDGLLVSLAAGSVDDAQPGRSASERNVRRAVQLIEEHCAEPLGTPDIAEAVGVSIRALQAGFKTHLDTTPMAYVRQERLRRVREALRDGSAGSVTEAALTWGIAHLGRLSGDYRAAFGETPSQTLRRSR